MFEFVVALVALGILAAAMWFAFKLVYPMLRKHSSDEPESARTQLIIPPDLQNPQDQTQHPRYTRAKNWFADCKSRVTGHFNHYRTRYVKLGTVLGLFAVAVLATAALVTTGETEKVSDDDSSEEEPVEEEETATAISDECRTWQLAESDNNQNRWFANGVPAIAEASTEDEAHQAVNEWLQMVRQDPDLLAGASLYLLDQKVEQDALFNDEGCATEVAVDLVNELEAVQSMSAVSAEEAPSDGVNSGVDESGQVTQANHVGVTGDRDAVKIVTPHGETVWVMARCGNPVAKRPPEDVPEGPTDEEPPPEEEPEPEPDQEQPAPEPTSEPEKPCGDGICGDPSEGADQQPVADNDLAHTDPEEGYEDPHREDTEKPGPAEENSREQGDACSGDECDLDQTQSGTEVEDSEDGGEAPGGGDESVDEPDEQSSDKDQQEDAGDPNPEYDGEEPSQGTNKGTSNDADSEEAQTDNSDDTEESGDPADDNEDTNMSLPEADNQSAESGDTTSTESSESDDEQESSDSTSSDSSDEESGDSGSQDSESDSDSDSDSGGATGQPVQD